MSTASLMVPSTWRNFFLYSSSYNGSAVWRKRETERQREVGRKEEAGSPWKTSYAESRKFKVQTPV